ncbi:MAG TPA: hypothetical protein VH351_04295 [Bryobacteraceae bacterium]|jgi:hypothetical protein|nr:hypothetical protein [Bryobacteraceae bacterium]
MARVTVKYVLAVLLAVFCVQAAAPSTSVPARMEIVCAAKAAQRICRKSQCAGILFRAQLPALTYQSQPKPEPEIALLFQRPPPYFSL